jgi:hypothetical protein
MSKDLKYTTWSSIFFAYINPTRRGLPLQEVCQVDIMCKRQLKYYRQLLLLDEKSLFSSMQGTFHSFKRQRMAPSFKQVCGIQHRQMRYIHLLYIPMLNSHQNNRLIPSTRDLMYLLTRLADKNQTPASSKLNSAMAF